VAFRQIPVRFGGEFRQSGQRIEAHDDPDWFDQTSTWKGPEVPLCDGRILVLKYT